MLVASVQVHLPNGFFMPGGYEFTMTLGAIALGLALTGGGALLSRRDDLEEVVRRSTFDVLLGKFPVQSAGAPANMELAQ